jgi:hypothetical protein
MNNLHDHYSIIDTLDFRTNSSQLILSYVYRIIALFVFGGLFYGYVQIVHGPTEFQTLVNIEIEGMPGIVSVLLLILDLVFVLYLHELIHAGVYYCTKKQKPKIGMRGWVIFAAAPRQINSRQEMIVNAIAPFAGISLAGLTALSCIPIEMASWVFIPTLANAAASGGDFMTIAFVLKQEKNALFNDVGDIIYSILPIK